MRSQELWHLSPSDIFREIDTLEYNLGLFLRDLASGKEKNHRKGRNLRRSLARAKTILRMKQKSGMPS